MTVFFPVHRGVRRGCPISPLLFILVGEILACKIRSDDQINGIKIVEECYKISQLADDTTLFISDLPSLQLAFKVLDDFSQVSGLTLNKNKTQVMCLHSRTIMPNIGVTWVQDKFKTLGIWFSRNKQDMTELNFIPCIENLKCLLNIWKQRDLSLKGRIIILKALAVPKLIYICSVLFVPKWFIKQVDKLFTDFLWKSKPPKVKKKNHNW